MQLALQNKDTGNVYPIVKWDKEAGTITLKGKQSTFTERFDKDKLKKLGYTLVEVESPPTTNPDNDEE